MAIAHHAYITQTLYPHGFGPTLIIRALPPGDYGLYERVTDTIHFNPHIHKSEAEVLDTIIHEHAHACVKSMGHGREFKEFYTQLLGLYWNSVTSR